MRAIAILAATALAFSLAACETTDYGDDPYYDAGFQDGCQTSTNRSSGTPASKAIRDQQLWDTSDGYRAGWRAGYASCNTNAHGDIPGR